jgi:hypothetical protein
LKTEPNGTYDAIIMAVSHAAYANVTKTTLKQISNGELMFFDIKSMNKNSLD